MKLAREHHPDKGGDSEKFKEIQKAHEILSDDGRRAAYDATGDENEQGGPGGPGPGFGAGMHFDLGQMFGGMFGGGMPFGMGGGPRPPQAPRRGKPGPKVHEMPVSLRDFYHGKTVKIQFDRQRFCTGCKGQGASTFEDCRACGGSGRQQHMVMMGPGMQGMMQTPCGACQTKGKQPVGTCWDCKGKKFTTEKKVLDFRIEPGMRPGQVIPFVGACSDQEDWTEAGDLHIILQAADEEGARFVASGDLLLAATSISLQEALLGKEEKMDGHPGHPQGLVVEIPVGTQNGDVITVAGEGMPRAAGGRGDLRITVRVTASEAEKEVLRGAADQIRALFSTSPCSEQTS